MVGYRSSPRGRQSGPARGLALGEYRTTSAGPAAQVLRRDVAVPLELGVEEAAAAVLRVATENMVSAIEEITINQGIDPRAAVLVGGGGAAGRG